MKPIKRYSSFEALKASEKKISDPEIVLKRHLEFERVIKSIFNNRLNKDDSRQSK